MYGLQNDPPLFSALINRVYFNRRCSINEKLFKTVEGGKVFENYA